MKRSYVLVVIAVLLSLVRISEASPTAQVNRLDPLSIPKYADPLVIPSVMPPSGTSADGTPEYEIAVRQFEQQILPSDFPATTVFGYGSVNDPATFHYPAFTIETRSDEPIRVTWLNQLVDENSAYLPHLLPVDQTVHWANPQDVDHEGRSQEPYTGPVPMVTHVHGAHVGPESDGYPEAWFLPAANNIPDDFAVQGPNYATTQEAPPGAAVFEYPNSQRATTLWYHDHTLGMTRVNVYAGMAGFWLIRDAIEDNLNLPGPAPALGDAPDTRYYEVPVVIQDRSFNEDGSLFYPTSREYFDGYSGPYIPESTVSPIWNPEFFGDTIVVNGRTWPYLEVEQRLYRLRFLNGTTARFLILKADTPLDFHVIGTDGGLLPDQPVVLDQLLIAPGERMDVIVDFSSFEPGDEIILLNLGPDEPFGGLPVEIPANPETTGQIMQFRVVEATDAGNSGEIPVTLPAIDRLTTDLPVRSITLNEEMSHAENMEDAVPVEALLGTDVEGRLEWHSPITENPRVNDVELWQFVNLTEDAHPLHLHMVTFQVVERIPFDADAYAETQETYLSGNRAGTPPNPLDFAMGDPIPPMSWESGWKDTVIANPGQITRIIARFDLEGLYVLHCHILEHEDNEMMRPYYVGEIPEHIPGIDTHPTH